MVGWAVRAVAMLVLFCATTARADDSVENAFRLCAIADQTGLTSEPCAVDGWNSSVEITLDMSAGEARKTCSALSDYIRDQGITFRKGWMLKLYSPYSNGKTIAYCEL